ncbi:MAG: type II toxin-antitoxin system HipA family toxin [Eggerthellaceae bacterium]|nr:type II toxin-antitoxin system HipA family toxin [Eggerthellaceae bacterium]
MENFKALEVRMNGEHVGSLATYRGVLTAFEYAESWLNGGFGISPFSLPLQKKLYIPNYDPCDGLFGVFADSLPDGWGRLLVDRMLLREHINPDEVNMLNRLAIVGDSGMGALSYYPCHEWQSGETKLDYDRMADECMRLLEPEYTGDLDEMFRLGGSSGGARPKILTRVDGEDWIVKFPSSVDRRDAGEIEYRYSLCAGKCGIEMAETRLFPSRQSSGYFGTKRFDRVGAANGTTERVHMLSVSALLEISHRIPNLDYNSLMQLTLELTKDYSEVEKMYRLMCFNVYAHNRDDHSKNFSFLYDRQSNKWKLAPAYDLTYSNSFGGEHATCVNGNGRDPAAKDILAVAEKIGIAKAKSKEIAEQVRQAVFEELGDVGQFSVSRGRII